MKSCEVGNTVSESSCMDLEIGIHLQGVYFRASWDSAWHMEGAGRGSDYHVRA